MEEMAELCKTLEQENRLLQHHLDSLNGHAPQNTKTQSHRPTSVISPELSCARHDQEPSAMPMTLNGDLAPTTATAGLKAPVSRHGVTLDQIKTLLEAANTFSSSMSTSAVSASTQASDSESMLDRDDENLSRIRKHVAPENSRTASVSKVPATITTSTRTQAALGYWLDRSMHT